MPNFNLAECDRVMVHHTHDAERPGIIIFLDEFAAVVDAVNVKAALEQIDKAVKTGILVLVDSAETYCMFIPATKMGDAPACDICGSITVRSGNYYKCLNCGASTGITE